MRFEDLEPTKTAAVTTAMRHSAPPNPWNSLAARLRVLVRKAPRDATDLWLLVCFLAGVVVALYISALAHLL